MNKLEEIESLAEVIGDRRKELAKIIILQRADKSEMGQVIDRYLSEWSPEYAETEQ